MADKDLVLFQMKSEQFVKDIKAKAKQINLIKIPDQLSVQVVITIDDKTYAKLEKDPRLQDEMRKNLPDTYQKLVDAVASAFEVANARVVANIEDADVAYNKALTEAQGKIEKACQEMVKDAAGVWKAYFKDQKDYLKYEVKIAVRLTVGAVSLGANIALLASTPFSFGAGAVIGIIGMAKTTSSMIQEIRNALKSTETALKDVIDLYEAVKEKAKSEKKIDIAKQKAKDYTKEAINGIANIALGIKPAKSISKMESALELAHKKLLGEKVKLVDISKKIQKKIDKIDVVQAALKNKALGNIQGLSEKELGYSPAKLDQLEKQLDVLLKNNDKMNERFELIVKLAERYTRFVKLLLDEKRDVKIFGELLEKLSTVYDVATAFVDFDGSLTAISNVLVSVGSVAADKGLDQGIDQAFKLKK